MKRALVSILYLFAPFIVFSQRYSDRSYDIIGLANGDKISECISNGLPFLILGIIIIFFSLSSSQKEAKEKGQSSGSPWGCLGMILVGVSAIIMLPLLAWIEAATVSIITLLSILAILFLIWESIKK